MLCFRRQARRISVRLDVVPAAGEARFIGDQLEVGKDCDAHLRVTLAAGIAVAAIGYVIFWT